jgi:hypothetical protein
MMGTANGFLPARELSAAKGRSQFLIHQDYRSDSDLFLAAEVENKSRRLFPLFFRISIARWTTLGICSQD